MSSEQQRKKGYPLPANVEPEDTLSFCVTIPNDPAFYNAFYYQLHSLGKWWMWKRDPDRPNDASASAMTWRDTFSIDENCDGGLDMATQEDIAKGMYQAFNWLALQIASGQYANLNISTDEDGVVTLPSGDADSDVELPEDDEDTPDIDESLAAKAGGVGNVRIGFANLWSNMNIWYSAPNNITNVTMWIRLNALYKWVSDEALDAFIAAYYSTRAASGTVPTTAATTLDSYLFCRGVNKQSVSAWALATLTGTVQEAWLNLMVAISDEQFSDWYASGLDTPSLNYKDMSCVPSPTEVIYMPVLGTTYISQTSWKPAHRLELTVENFFTDTDDNDIADFWWYKTLAGSPVSRISTVNIQQGTGITKPTTNVVPYTTSHKYVFTIDTVTAGQMQLTVPATNMATPVGSVPSEGFKVTIRDIGEIGV